MVENEDFKAWEESIENIVREKHNSFEYIKDLFIWAIRSPICGCVRSPHDLFRRWDELVRARIQERGYD